MVLAVAKQCGFDPHFLVHNITGITVEYLGDYESEPPGFVESKY